MEIFSVLRPLARWWWLILLSVILATGGSYLSTDRQQPVYSSRTTLMVGSTIQSLNPTNTDFQLSRQLASLYADIAQREPVRNSTMKELGLTSLPNYTVDVPGDGQLIEIVVEDANPSRAQAVANELASQLVARVPESSSQVNSNRQQFTEEQLTYLEGKIKETQVDIDNAKIDLGEMNSAGQIADAESNINALESKLSDLQTTYASLLSTTSDQAVNTISVIEPADLPTHPANTQKWIYIALAATLGLSLSIAAAFLLELMDNSLEDEGDVIHAVDVPVVGRIWRDSKYSSEADGEFLSTDKESPHYEAFRALRTNLEFADLDAPLRSILVASPGEGDGKSTVAVNLALAYASADRKTLLIDADLRRPSVHRLLGLTNFQGLRQLSSDQSTLVRIAQRSSVSDNLWVVPAGSADSPPTEFLSLPRMNHIMESADTEFDVTIIDSPPSLLSDASILASAVEGVLLVVRLNHTPEAALKSTIQQLRRVRANVLGVVINDSKRPYSRGYLGYLSGSGAMGPDSRNHKGGLRSLGSRIRGLVRSSQEDESIGE